MKSKAGARAMRDAGVKLCEMESFNNPQGIEYLYRLEIQ